MPRIHIVSDSSARFSNPRLIKYLPLSILPNRIQLGGRWVREGEDLDAEQMLQRIAQADQPPKIAPPAVSDYAELFVRLSHSCDGVISIHPSRELSASWQNGRLAAQQAAGSCQIAVIDSQNICAAQGMLIHVAAQAAQQAATVHDAIQTVRRAVERIYSLYCVDDVGFLQSNGIITASHAALCSHLGLKPLVSLEEGQPIVIGKVQTSGQVIDRLHAFMAEFIALDEAVILQRRQPITDETRLLQDRLALDFPGQHFPFTSYSAAAAVLLGTRASGVAVLEKELDADYGF